ncbi:MAG: hypothetical protein ACR2RA_05470 [Geminicoccaceae bacterium]
MKRTASFFALMLTGCAPVTEAGIDNPRAERIFAGATKTEVWQAVMTSLEASDLPVVAADFDQGKIRARQHNYLDRRWAACPSPDLRSFDPLSPVNLGARSSPLYRGVDLRLEVAETETGTRLALDPRYSDVGRDDGRSTFAFQISCRSTGVLEQTLFTAAGGA